MYDFQQRNKLRKLLYSKVAMVVFLVVAIFLVRGAITVVKKEVESRRNVKLVEQKLNLAREKYDELSRNIVVLETESGVEREIRNKFSVTREGEEVAIIIEPVGNVDDVLPKKISFWSRISGWFDGLFE